MAFPVTILFKFHDNTTYNCSLTECPISCLSNWQSGLFEYEGKFWQNAEACFQAQKFTDPRVKKAIRLSGSPHRAVDIGRSRQFPIRKDWDSVRCKIMKDILTAKFTQIQKYKEFLLESGNCELVYNMESDPFWGIGHDNGGQNMLGKILMEIREELKPKALIT